MKFGSVRAEPVSPLVTCVIASSTSEYTWSLCPASLWCTLSGNGPRIPKASLTSPPLMTAQGHCGIVSTLGMEAASLLKAIHICVFEQLDSLKLSLVKNHDSEDSVEGQGSLGVVVKNISFEGRQPQRGEVCRLPLSSCVLSLSSFCRGQRKNSEGGEVCRALGPVPHPSRPPSHSPHFRTQRRVPGTPFRKWVRYLYPG